MIEAGNELLRSKYRLISGPITKDSVGQAWLGVDEDDTQFLVKVWPFQGERPDDFGRALWDTELRMLYRVGSSPGAEDALLVLRNAGVDLENRCFVMVLEAPGYQNLASVIPHRASTPWFNVRDPQARSGLWASILGLASGVRLLHEQHIIHRNLGAEAVFFNPELGPDSLRLGGFEWSVRLGTPSTDAPPPNWSSPPEFFKGVAFGYRPETDWFAFGMLAVRLLLNVEPFAKHEPLQRHEQVLKRLARSGGPLSDLERAFLHRLIAFDPQERITRGHEVIGTIKDILKALDTRTNTQVASGSLVVVVNPTTSQELLEQALDLGFVPSPEKPHEPFNPHDVIHEAHLTSFLQKDLVHAQLYAVQRASYYLLVGARLTLRLTQFEHTDRRTNTVERTWDLAFCRGTGELRWNEGGSACTDLPSESVVVRTRKQASNRAVRQNARSWEPYLPTIDQTVALRASLAQFHDFLRCTNQLELLIRDSEIFRHRVVSTSAEGGKERLVIREIPRPGKGASFYQIEGGMAEFLLRELQSGKRDCHLVILTGPEHDGLMLPSIEKSDCWTIENIDTTQGRVTLARVIAGGTLPPPTNEGTVRTWGMFGQVALIRRRKRAIDRVAHHSYLLRSLSAPGQVYMDTGEVPLPVEIDGAMVDEAKQAAIKDIMRVRPIYALQGPPGTGKTTLVAHLLRQVFEDDPVAQVLITAQAHGAVDVLRAKVRNEAFHGIPEEEQPLAVRLRRPDPNALSAEEGSPEEVGLRILQRANRRLQDCPNKSDLQRAWLRVIETMQTSLENWAPSNSVPDFCEVVKRGANVTYCTTSAGDLEVLADATQSFDWAIIEEAGKAHGFDLALPLQAGHRWLLIGDHKQLPPYRFRDYREGIDALDAAVAALEELPDRAGGLLDVDWIQSWTDREAALQEDFKEYSRGWLNAFQRIFDYCSVATGSERHTIDRADGAAAGKLSRQHRMHPTIGDLISAVYYDGVLVNRTLDEEDRPLSRVRHPFDKPSDVGSKAIIWLDLPWADSNTDFAEVGPETGRPRYTNPKEVEALTALLNRLGPLPYGRTDQEETELTLAVLSPYNQQVALINRSLEQDTVRAIGLKLKQALRSGQRASGLEESARVAHTVDSFQGNQADIIAVSLVRNNTLPIGEGLGFLSEAPRINVLLSRAERLLVLVGSWAFFQHQLGAVSLDDPHHPLWHWKMVLATLDTLFQNGQALRIDAGTLK